MKAPRKIRMFISATDILKTSVHPSHPCTRNCQVLDAEGKLVLPGLIDDQVHFREPGLTHKACISSESQAAVAGGTTTFFEMPNVSPPTLDKEKLEEKYAIARNGSKANFGFLSWGK